ncbi:MAG: sugar transferase [Clostridiales bacterium]|nr:sugar transferase [Clostridiales bacterium]
MRTNNSLLKHLDFIIIDILCLSLAFVLSFCGYHYIRTGGFVSLDSYNGAYRLIIILVLFSHLFIALAGAEYSGILRRDSFAEARNLIWHNSKVLVILLMVLFFLKTSATYSRLILLSTFVLNTLFCFVLRVLRKKHLLHSATEKISSGRRILIITNHEQSDSLNEILAPRAYSGYQLAGTVKPDEYEEYIKEHVVDEAFISIPESDVRNDVIEKLIDMGIIIHLDMGEYLENMPNSTVENINDRTVITAGINPMNIRQRFIKRTMDIIISVIGLVFTAVVFLIVAPIIFIQSPGHVIFKQKRVGRNGRIFDFYKFRSMYPDAEKRKAELMEQNKMQGLMFKMDNDPRIIPIGHFLRKSSIDELPQFWNVLKGDMSLVGTRPPTLDEFEKYSLYHASRLSIKPGITGLWQISGRSDITDFEQVVKLDREYIRHFSLREDMRILLRTIAVIFTRKGSM